MAIEYQFQSVVSIKLSDEERDGHTINDEHAGAAVAAMQRDGIVVLENAVQVEHVDTLNKILTEEADTLASLPTTHFNDNSAGMGKTGNMSQPPPVTPNLMFTDIWANGAATSVISSILGPKPHITYVNGNTNLGGFNGIRQTVHADLTFNHATFPFAIVANYYLVDVSPANGSTELWVGSHRDTSFADHKNCTPTFKEEDFGIRDELLEARRKFAPPVQPTVKRGSVVLRDLRLWHAGLSNPSAQHRIMLAWVYTPWWYKCPAVVVLPEGARKLVEGWEERDTHPVVYHAHYVPDGVDHKTIEFTPVFESANESFNALLPPVPYQ
ncbi:hypothetical protein BJX64DRAFT_293542 [Aspergillus heterothallicus]